MKLQDTIELMNSSDSKDRFKAEYYQLKIRMVGKFMMEIYFKEEIIKFQYHMKMDVL